MVTRQKNPFTVRASREVKMREVKMEERRLMYSATCQ